MDTASDRIVLKHSLPASEWCSRANDWGCEIMAAEEAVKQFENMGKERVESKTGVTKGSVGTVSSEGVNESWEESKMVNGGEIKMQSLTDDIESITLKSTQSVNTTTSIPYHSETYFEPFYINVVNESLLKIEELDTRHAEKL